MTLNFADCRLDSDRRELTRGGEPVAIEPRTFDLLVYLVENRDRAIGKDELQDKVWGTIVSDAAMTRAVMKLRKAVGDSNGGVAIIKVGAATETEMKEKKARVEDSMHATRAAVEEGIVPGGGVCLVRVAEALNLLKLDDADEQTGVRVVRRALEEPLRWIAQNAGFEGAIVVEKVRASKNSNFGFNAGSDTYEDMVMAGVIDPAKVTRTALQNAASIAGLMLTTEAVVSELPAKKAEAAMQNDY